MSGRWDANRLVAEVHVLAGRALPREEYHRELAARLRRAFDFDAACWHALDPETLLLTTAHPEELLAGGFMTPETEADVARTVLASEYERDDYNAFAALARRRAPVGILSEATRGRPERSPRFSEWLGPRDMPFEMRAALVTRGRAWGCVVFHRSAGRGDFTRDEARLMARLSRPIAEGLRDAIRADAARQPFDEDAPGMVVLGRGDEVELLTPQARRLLEPLARGGGSLALPMPVLAVAAAARAGRRGGEPPAVHVPTRDGWLSLYASLPEGRPAGRVAVVIQRTAGEDAAPLRLESYGLTAREREVAGLVAAGLDTKTIADRLFVSPWTVRDHLKAIFDKTGARSRRELRARVFYDDYLPGMLEGAPLDQAGRPAAVR
ncbi:MAG TPA: helix-turn-helix transcriptional regulator [Solirubrobacteraceae bacterium]|nr:helix-turn-helix transcriptional regulator [Solirubrobacteraceae bacterium]